MYGVLWKIALSGIQSCRCHLYLFATVCVSNWLVNNWEQAVQTYPDIVLIDLFYVFLRVNLFYLCIYLEALGDRQGCGNFGFSNCFFCRFWLSQVMAKIFDVRASCLTPLLSSKSALLPAVH